MSDKTNIPAPGHSEDRIQQDIFLFLNNTFCLAIMPDRGIIYHVPNQRISKVERMKLAAIGVLAGASDLIFVFRGKVIFLEIKTTTGRQDPAQKEFQSRIEANGFRYYLVRSVEDVKEVVRLEFGTHFNEFFGVTIKNSLNK